MLTMIRRPLATFVVSFVAPIAALAGLSHAATLVGWTFEGAAPENFIATVGGTTGITQAALPAVAPEINAVGVNASLTALHANAARYYAGNGNGSATGFFSNAWSVGDYDQVAADLTGYDNYVVSLDVTGSNTGPRTFVAQYSTDGSTFTDFGTYDVPLVNGTSANFSTATFNPVFHFDLPLPAAVRDVTAFRLVDSTTTSVVGGTTGGSGTNRLDNLIITGNATAVPEPTSLTALVGVATLAIARRRRA